MITFGYGFNVCQIFIGIIVAISFLSLIFVFFWQKNYANGS